MFAESVRKRQMGGWDGDAVGTSFATGAVKKTSRGTRPGRVGFKSESEARSATDREGKGRCCRNWADYEVEGREDKE